MRQFRKVEIHKQTRLVDDFFKVDQVIVSYERQDGTMSPDETRFIFERGDAVAIILLNVDTQSVVLVNQFKVPSLIGRRRDDPTTTNGWITETTAGMIDGKETPEQAIIRETKEETGYQIKSPKLISRFFSSPGGTSERIFLYFAEVREVDRIGKGGGVDREDITVVQTPLDDLLDRLAKGSIDDPKLAIGAYWLKEYLKARADDLQLVESMQLAVQDLFKRLAGGSIENPRLAEAARWLQANLQSSEHAVLSGNNATASPAARSGPLQYSTVRYRLKDKPEELVVGYKTGHIDGIHDVDIWVNSENTNMLMDRFIGQSISARIRYLGSNRDEEGNVIEDTIFDELRTAVGPRGHVPIATVLVTESGLLKKSPHRVQRIIHVATVEADPGAAIVGRRDKLTLCAQRVLERAEQENRRLGRVVLNLCRNLFKLKELNCESILIPMMGAGQGNLPVEEAAQIIISAAVDHLCNIRLPTLKEVYFLAFTARDRNACAAVLEKYRAQGTLSLAG